MDKVIIAVFIFALLFLIIAGVVTLLFIPQHAEVMVNPTIAINAPEKIVNGTTF
jgi:hypothetical protein